jgi:hypothetical protein
VNLIKDVAPKAAFKKIEKDIDKTFKRIEAQINEAKNIKTLLEKEN